MLRIWFPLVDVRHNICVWQLLECVRWRKSPAFFLGHLNWLLVVFVWVKVLILPWTFLKGRKQRLLFDFVKPWVLKMVTKVEHFYETLLKANSYIGFELLLPVWKNLLRNWVSCRLSLILVFAHQRLTRLRNFSCTEWLKVILNDIEPNHLHLDFWKIGELPENNLVTHVKWHEYIWAKVFNRILSAILRDLYHTDKVSFDLVEIKHPVLDVSP